MTSAKSQFVNNVWWRTREASNASVFCISEGCGGSAASNVFFPFLFGDRREPPALQTETQR
jgi:hypothetical protein